MIYEKQYIESKKLFMALSIELKNAFSSLIHFDSEVSMELKKVGIYRHLKKLIPCFDILLVVSKSDSVQSLITLQRMIVDNYAIFFLLTSHSSKEEQILRYYLYLLDAVVSRTKIIDQFSKGITSELPKNEYVNANSANILDIESAKNLKEKIRENQRSIILADEIIEKTNWKFKDPSLSNQNKNRYKWSELYSISKIPNHHAKMIQNYNSSFVHGLGISMMVGHNENDIFPFRISAMDFCSVLMSLIIKILTVEFEKEISKVKFNDKTLVFINNNWNNWK
ncbi:MAG: hypothetical protein IMY72_00365 [Bacteroidetes bacterium]|nr:hypothetical protein [Bacteroidota bacterium]